MLPNRIKTRFSYRGFEPLTGKGEDNTNVRTASDHGHVWVQQEKAEGRQFCLQFFERDARARRDDEDNAA